MLCIDGIQGTSCHSTSQLFSASHCSRLLRLCYCSLDSLFRDSLFHMYTASS
jgi:hypothetical protein